jgi:hypothetical protein
MQTANGRKPIRKFRNPYRLETIAMKSTARGLTTAALALAGAMSVSVSGPHRAYAAPSPSVSQADSNLAITVLSPMPHTDFNGAKPIEVSAFYQGSDTNAISAIELYIDGSNAFTKHLDAPEPRGVISFLIDTSQLTPGEHAVVVRAVASDAEVVSAKSSFVYIADSPSTPQSILPGLPSGQSDNAPELSYISPSMDDKVSGVVKVELNASEADGKSPYVSVFIDRTFKTLRNYPPYEYDWDTTAYTNGYHTVEAYGYDEAQNVGPAQIMRVYVNNPGGDTQVRTDLQDAAPAPSPKSTATSGAQTALTSGATAPRSRSKRSPSLIADNHPVLEGLDYTDEGLSNPYIPSARAGTNVAIKAVPTIPIRPEDAMSLAPVRVATRDGGVGSAYDLSNPYETASVTTSGARLGGKAIGPSRRPSPIMSAENIPTGLSMMRTIMMAKQPDLLDETGGLHPESQLSDPYIPDTASPKPDSRATHTPLTGFKPMPSATSTSAPVLAGEQAKPLVNAPALIDRDAHTVPVRAITPSLADPTIDAITPPHAVKVIAPVATPKPMAIHTGAVPHPAKLAVHTAAPTLHRHIAVHTGGAIPWLRAKGQMKVMFNHASLQLDRPLTPRAGVMFSPLRQIFEFQGGTLTWQHATGRVRATSNTRDITLTIGETQATVNKAQVRMQLAPYLDEGRTMVPLSFLPMALDVNVQFDPGSGHLLITTKE